MSNSLKHAATDFDGVARHFLALIENFRDVAIENDRESDTGPLAELNDHYIGPVQPQHLGAAPAFPVAWSVPMGYSPSYKTGKSDQGTLQFQVVLWVKDQDMAWALEKALILAMTVVDNLERDPALTTGSNDIAVESTTWTNFDLDFAPRAAQGNEPQLRFALLEFDVVAKRIIPW